MVRLTAVFVGLAACALAPALAEAHPGHAGVELEGTFQLSHSDDFRGGEPRFYTTLRRSNDSLRLQLPARHGLRSGDRIRIQGARHGGRVRVQRLTRLAPASTRSPAALGPRRVAVLLFTFAGDGRQPYTPEQAAATMFGGPTSVSAYFQEASFGATTLSGTVFGWYTIAGSASGCAVDQWAEAADGAAAAAGVSLAGYDHVVYAFPSAGCGWSGLAEMPGRRVWVNGAFNLRVLAHELTHNLGTHHAASLTCTSGGVRVPVGPSCSANEYGDPFDVMGSSSRHTSSWHKGQIGWLGALSMQSVTASGRYTIAPQEWFSPGVQSLRIPRGATGNYLYLEFRQPHGFDGFAAGDAAVNGVTIRIAPDYRSRQPSYLVDTTGATSTFLDSALGAGRTFTDEAHGISIRTAAVSASGATVDISLGGAPRVADSSAPGSPRALAGTLEAGPRVALAWGAATDDVAVTGYRIYRDGAELGTTAALTFADLSPPAGRTVSYAVRAHDAAGNLGPTSYGVSIAIPAPPVAPPQARPANQTAPTIAGAPARAAVLTAGPGIWTGTAPIRHSFRWQRCDRTGRRCASIARATRSTYRVVQADVGRTLRVLVTATNPYGSAAANSTTTSTVSRTPARARNPRDHWDTAWAIRLAAVDSGSARATH